jgi:hypothetical protein
MLQLIEMIAVSNLEFSTLALQRMQKRDKAAKYQAGNACKK